MPRQPLNPAIVTRVEKFWAEEAHPPMGEVPSRRGLHARYLAEVANEISWGSFNTIVRRLEAAAPKEPLDIKYWEPWVNPEESTEDTACLLKINAVMRAENGRNLYDVEAKWAGKLRGPLQGVPPFGQSRLVMHYALRELRAYYLKKKPYTDDLDNLVAYRPWFKGNPEAYHFALSTGLAPDLDLDPFGTLRNSPHWEEIIQEFKYPWLAALCRILRPSGSHIPGVQDHPEHAEILDQVVKFWGRPTDEDQPAPGAQETENRDAYEEERRVRNSWCGIRPDYGTR